MLGRLCRTTLARRQPFLRPPQHQLRGLAILRPPSTLHTPASAIVRRLCSNGDKVPKGFGGFYKQRPKAPRAEEAGKEEAGEASEAGSGKASEASGDKGSAKASGSGGGSSGGGSGGGGGRRRRDDDGDGDPDGMFGGMQAQAAMAALAAVTLYASLQRSPSEAREVTFSDFRRELLESGNVDRIEIVNKTKARVYMRADVPGVPPPAPFYFTLGNVSGLEKKLEHAQEDLGVAPRDYVAVTYVSETSWGGELLKIAPTLLLIGFWVLMMRGFGGGAMGGGGGGGGITQSLTSKLASQFMQQTGVRAPPQIAPHPKSVFSYIVRSVERAAISPRVCARAEWHGRRRRLRRLRRQQRRLRSGDAAQPGAVRPEPPQVPHKGVQILPGPRRMQERCAPRFVFSH